MKNFSYRNGGTKVWIGLRKRISVYEWVDEREPLDGNNYVKKAYGCSTFLTTCIICLNLRNYFNLKKNSKLCVIGEIQNYVLLGKF